jgi:DNA-binding NarL/FixJ family response regulator
MGKIRLLIIDDHVKVRDALQVSLGNKPNLEVLTSDAAPETLIQTVESIAPDVVIFEPKSQDGDGVEACRRILSVKCQPVVIVLTSYHSEQEEMNFVELGVSRYLLKDVDTQSLYEEIVASYADRQAHDN